MTAYRIPRRSALRYGLSLLWQGFLAYWHRHPAITVEFGDDDPESQTDPYPASLIEHR